MKVLPTIRGLRTAASLKHVDAASLVPRNRPYPRPPDRGLIEAL